MISKKCLNYLREINIFFAHPVLKYLSIFVESQKLNKNQCFLLVFYKKHRKLNTF